MKRFPDTYNEANEKSGKYSSAPRAGWIEQGKRTKANQAILVGRQEAVQLADDLAQALYGGNIFLQQFFELRSTMEQLAQGMADSKRCPKCHNIYRTGWLEGKCPYCEAEEAARKILNEKMDGGKEG